MTDFSARDLARDLIASGVQPGGGSAMNTFADPLAAESRLMGAIVRAAERDLGLVIASPDVKVINYRQAAFIAAGISSTSEGH